MKQPSFYLGEGKFTQKGPISRDIASQITGKYPIDGIDEFVKSLPYAERKNLFRKRDSDQIIKDGFVRGCTDSGLVFITLARIKGFPAAYVETLEEGFLQEPTRNTVEGHIFADVYSDSAWIPYNPGHGRTEKEGKIYLFKNRRKYVEMARGLDFSELFVGGESKPIELATVDQIRQLAQR